MSIDSRNQTVDVLRAFGILLMISGHIGLGVGRAEYIFSTWYHSFHMPLFFILSGYFFSAARPKWTQFVMRKAKTLLLPYILWALFHIAYNSLRFKVPFAVQGNLVQPFLHPTQKLFPIAGALWFLPALFWANLLYDLIFRLISNQMVRFGGSLVLCFAGMLLCKKQIFLPMGMDAALTAIGFMSIGTLLKDLPEHKGNKLFNAQRDLLQMKPLAVILLLILFFTLVFLNGPVNFRVGEYPSIILSFLDAVLGTLLMWNLVEYLIRLFPKKITTVFARIGQDSIFFLCTNQLLIKELLPYAARWTGNSLAGRLCLNVFLTILVSLIALMLSLLFNRSRLLRKFLGR